MRLIVLLVEAGLELVPKCWRQSTEGTGSEGSAHSIPVLDAYFHHDRMSVLTQAGRRGRGDIVHTSLLVCQRSILIRRHHLRVFVHTREDKVISVDLGVEVHPNYIRFLQQMGTLLNGGRVPGYTIESKRLEDLVQELEVDRIIVLSQFGKELPLKSLVDPCSNSTILVIVGAFAEGDYQVPIHDIADELISLGPRLMKVPEVISEVLHAFTTGGNDKN